MALFSLSTVARAAIRGLTGVAAALRAGEAGATAGVGGCLNDRYE